MKKLVSCTAVAIGLAFAAEAVGAEGYTINGRAANPQDSAYLKQNGLPHGHYWLNRSSGDWGVAGDPMPRGNFYAGSGDESFARSAYASFSGHGKCYYFGDWSTC